MNDARTNKPARLRRQVLDWFYANRENYFFRNNRTPYRVWVSETILQQTRMNAALDKIEHFLNCFPGIEALAEAREEDVLAAFKGLGYYNRARNLHKGARFILENFGQFPSEYEDLLTVPSIGPYTAAAIASISFGRHIPVIDGNIKRILARIFRLEYEIKDPVFLTSLSEILKTIFDSRENHPGDLNEALMEFGQKTCRAKNPQCADCFFQKHCLAFENNLVSSLPVIKKPGAKKIVTWKLYFFIRGDQVLLNRFTDFYLLKNHIGFPSVLEIGENCFFSTKGKWHEKFLKDHRGHEFLPGRRHSITDHQIRFMYSIVKLNEREIQPALDEELFWWPLESVETRLVSSGLHKTWATVLGQIIARGGT